MSELTTGSLIKILLGVFVVVAVAGGLYLLFKDKIISFFKSLSPDMGIGTFMALLKYY